MNNFIEENNKVLKDNFARFKKYFLMVLAEARLTQAQASKDLGICPEELNRFLRHDISCSPERLDAYMRYLEQVKSIHNSVIKDMEIR